MLDFRDLRSRFRDDQTLQDAFIALYRKPAFQSVNKYFANISTVLQAESMMRTPLHTLYTSLCARAGNGAASSDQPGCQALEQTDGSLLCGCNTCQSTWPTTECLTAMNGTIWDHCWGYWSEANMN